MRECLYCAIHLEKRHQIKFCSNKCQANHQYNQWVKSWKKGSVTGNIGITTANISKYLKRYLVEKFGNKCSMCGWSAKHPVTGIIPLEIDHIDGNANDSTESNLRLICPNCHALTPFYKNLNKGRGRKWRMNKYIKNNTNVSLERWLLTEDK